VLLDGEVVGDGELGQREQRLPGGERARQSSPVEVPGMGVIGSQSRWSGICWRLEQVCGIGGISHGRPPTRRAVMTTAINKALAEDPKHRSRSELIRQIVTEWLSDHGYLPK
jgi:hypothetical protein